ncbi:MAG: anion permease [Desulfovibrio sp.]|jgi:DASS family divalent anion:Na+ symporter|nr:anion permease [Desulfovibrio sp.]
MTETSKTKERVKLIASAVAVLLGVWIGVQPPPEGLTVTTMYGIGIAVWGVLWWVTGIIPDYITGLLMCTLWAAFGSVTFPQAFTSFSRPVWWLVIVAFAIGSMAQKVGLLNRIALYVLKVFPSSYKGQIWGILSAGFIISPLIPSVNGKAALSAPIGLAISDTLGMERKSKGCCGILAACLTGFYQSSSCFLSGTSNNYLLLGIIGGYAAGAGDVSWLAWLGRAAVFAAVLFFGMGLFITTAFKPEGDVRLPAGYSDECLKKLGPMSRDERITLTVMLLILLMWMTEPLHKINAGIVGVTGICLLGALGVMTRKDFLSGIDWPSVMFIGTLLNMASVVGVLKIDKYLGDVLKPVLSVLVTNPYMLVAALILVVTVLKFGIVSLATSTVIVIFAFMPAAIAINVDPWIVAFIVWASCQIFVLPYMNSAYLCAHYATKGEMADHAIMSKQSVFFTALCIVGAFASIPFWQMLGLIN